MAQVYLLISYKTRIPEYIYIARYHRIVFCDSTTICIKNKRIRQRYRIENIHTINIIIDKMQSPPYNYDQFKEICCYGM